MYLMLLFYLLISFYTRVLLLMLLFPPAMYYPFTYSLINGVILCLLLFNQHEMAEYYIYRALFYYMSLLTMNF